MSGVSSEGGCECAARQSVCMPAMRRASLHDCNHAPAAQNVISDRTAAQVGLRCPGMPGALCEQTAPDCSHPEGAHGLRRRAAGGQAVQQQPQPACVAPAGLPAAPAAAPLLHDCKTIQMCHSCIIAPLVSPQHSVAITEPDWGSFLSAFPAATPLLCEAALLHGSAMQKAHSQDACIRPRKVGVPGRARPVRPGRLP